MTGLAAGAACLGVAARVDFDSKVRKQVIILWSQAIRSRRFQRGFHRVNLHRPTWEPWRSTGPRPSPPSPELRHAPHSRACQMCSPRHRMPFDLGWRFRIRTDSVEGQIRAD
jgi:hypothetical protein